MFQGPRPRFAPCDRTGSTPEGCHSLHQGNARGIGWRRFFGAMRLKPSGQGDREAIASKQTGAGRALALLRDAGFALSSGCDYARLKEPRTHGRLFGPFAG
ncbi:protein of unknown function [Methylocella tundrae]|uniref:Uncharacterized protein n=1 Tax=Methylocella tundrae TaxID=227605 RepID=A0A4U8Z381_METTU|nr:protein of unknown function [Methylocella tundrae]